MMMIVGAEEIIKIIKNKKNITDIQNQ